MDKRDLSQTFRMRLRTLLERTGTSRAAFAASVGIDRSALSQLLGDGATRLPRAETLINVADRYNVSLDWLLGLSEDEGLASEIKHSFEIEEGLEGFERTLLAKWHAEAAGTKIRYVPAGIPDLLRTEEVIDFEAGLTARNRESQRDEARYRLDYNRRPETDMEVCMPLHALKIFAAGQGVWSDLPAPMRQRQLDHMARLLDDLYPSFRLFLYDGRKRYSVPYTIFGQIRAAIFMGDSYLVLNAPGAVASLTRHFDHLIRATVVHAHEAQGFVAGLQTAGD